MYLVIARSAPSPAQRQSRSHTHNRVLPSLMLASADRRVMPDALARACVDRVDRRDRAARARLVCALAALARAVVGCRLLSERRVLPLPACSRRPPRPALTRAFRMLPCSPRLCPRRPRPCRNRLPSAVGAAVALLATCVHSW